MNKQEDLLRKACALLAEEEADYLEDHLSPAQISEAEDLFSQHHAKIFSLIRKETGKKKSGMPAFLKIAACLAIIAGAAFFALQQSAPDPTPMTPIPSASISPYYSPSPTEIISPTEAPASTPSPTIVPTSSPTSTPLPTNSPTIVPTKTVSPTFTPSPDPTPEAETAAAPMQWQGHYFPQHLPEGYAFADTEEDHGSRSIVYTKGTSRIIFSEFDGQKALPIPENAQFSYVQIGDYIALKAETENSVILSWEQDGYTFSLTCPNEAANEIAASVKKVSRQ